MVGGGVTDGWVRSDRWLCELTICEDRSWRARNGPLRTNSETSGQSDGRTE